MLKFKSDPIQRFVMQVFAKIIFILFFFITPGWSQIWFPGPGNVYLESTPTGLKVTQLREQGWKRAPQMAPELVLVSDSIRSSLNNATWQKQIPGSSIIMAPEGEKRLLSNISSFWTERLRRHFHDYSCESTDVLSESLDVDQWLVHDQKLEWPHLYLTVHAFSTPGPTSNSMSYLITHKKSGEKLLYSGNLVFDGARLLELYKFQDSIPEAGLRGYHGYAGRLSSLLESFRLLRDLEFNSHFSSDGLIGTAPGEVFFRAEEKTVQLYQSYLSTSALHWYFGDRFLDGSFSRLASGAPKPPPPNFSSIKDTPQWVISIGTTRIIQSSSGKIFLLDCGSQNVIDFIDNQIEAGKFKGVGGIFVTHYHDDHTDFVQKASEKYGCPVYSLPEYADLLENPSSYHLPCLTHAPIKSLNVVPDGTMVSWEEFQFTYRFFPGQTWYHGALLVHLREDPTEAILFAGDAFTPSGIDDYCLLNRNILNPDSSNSSVSGYFQCLEILLDYDRQVPGHHKMPFYTANQHVKPIFRLRSDKIYDLKDRLSSRLKFLTDVMKKDSISKGMDPYWFSLYPYMQNVNPDESFSIKPKLVIPAGSGLAEKAQITLHFPEVFVLEDSSFMFQQNEGIGFSKSLDLPPDISPGVYPITASIKLFSNDGMQTVTRPHFTEALIVVD